MPYHVILLLCKIRMDNETVRVAVGLRLGVALCSPHSCQHCGATVDQFGLHGLSCRFSTGRHYRHAALNRNLRE